MLDNLKIMWHQGKQFIPDVRTAQVPGVFRGRPVISTTEVIDFPIDLCPADAIKLNPFSIDLGRCTFCGECAARYPQKVRFTKDYKMGTNDRSQLIIKESIANTIVLNDGDDVTIQVDAQKVRDEIRRLFSGSLKLRQVSAGGDNSCELELNASDNVQFDVSRFGVEFVASPRHADGIVITGPVTKNMASALDICYKAIPEPKIIILAGTDAISGGIFADSPELDRSFIENHHVDLYLPGNPVHPLTFINGVLNLIRK